jgi:hypothetical protein
LGFINTNASQSGFIADYTGTGALKVSLSAYNDTFNIYNETNGYSIINFTRSTKNLIFNPSGGNVGIGTTSPAYRLDVKGGNASNFRLDNDGSQFVQLLFERNSVANSGADILLDGTNGTFGLRTLAVIPITFSTSSSLGAPAERMRITSGGNVLIGTTTDAGYKLDVNGTGRFGGSTIPLRVEGATNTQAAFVRTATSYGAGLGLYTNSTLNWLLGTAWGETSSNFVLYNAGTGTQSLKIDYSTNAATFSSLAGTGSRAVLADTNGLLSAPVSDVSVKENIQSIGYGLNEIVKMNPVWFDFVDDYKNFGEGRQNGNIAQEMQKIIPEAVFTTPSTGKMGINYDQLHAVYIKAIQELKAEIELLKNK